MTRVKRVLIIQSAEPPYVLKGLEHLRQSALFGNPRFTIFCRDRPEILGSFRGHPMLSQILIHTEAQDSWHHWRTLVGQHFDAVVLFLTGDPSYWKVKVFAFLLGQRRLLVFDECGAWFIHNWRQWLSLIARRMRERPYPGASSRGGRSTHILVALALKSVIFPFRFLWLLLVWLRLRFAGSRRSRECDDCSL